MSIKHLMSNLREHYSSNYLCRDINLNVKSILMWLYISPFIFKELKINKFSIICSLFIENFKNINKSTRSDSVIFKII